MTRKHYIKIANAICGSIPFVPCELIDELCIVFKEDNSSFDSTRFKEYINEITHIKA